MCLQLSSHLYSCLLLGWLIKSLGLEPSDLRFGGLTNFIPGGLEGKASACNAGDLGSIPGWGRSPGEGNANPLQYSCLENHMDRGVWSATVHGVTESRIRLSDDSCLVGGLFLTFQSFWFCKMMAIIT